MITRTERKNLFLSVVLAFGLFGFGAAGCTILENVGGGSAVGAALGAGIGALVGDPAMGAAIGGGAGALGGVIKNEMEKETQDKAKQAQTNAQIQKLAESMEINRQVGLLIQEGKTPDKYIYSAFYGVNGGIIVQAKEKSVLPEIVINK